MANGISVFDKPAVSTMRKGDERSSGLNFTERELEIMHYVCRGMISIEIASELALRPGAVKNLVSLLLSKTGGVSRAQLVRYAIDRQLVD